MCVYVWIYAFDRDACNHQNEELDLLELEVEMGYEGQYDMGAGDWTHVLFKSDEPS